MYVRLRTKPEDSQMVHNPTKLGIRTSGPYNIKKVHVNGTVTMELRPGVSERINIRRIIPYRKNDD